jgi:ribosomal protein S18 acetylase RimI-like enzyme
MADAALLSRLNMHVQQLHADAYPALFKPPTADFAVSFFEMFLENPMVQIFIAEEAEGKAAGYVVCQLIHREENAFTFERDYVHVDQISVEPEQQGKGVGSALMARVDALAKEAGVTQITLDSWIFNTHAHHFFERHGYAVFNLRMWKER